MRGNLKATGRVKLKSSGRLEPGQVINPKLYRALEKRFGEVRVGSPGLELIGKTERITTASGRDHPVLSVRYWGEHYAVCCPKCGDTKHRLYFSQRFGVSDKHGLNKNLVYCFNENCYAEWEDREHLYSLLFNFNIGSQKITDLRKGKTLTEVELKVVIPGITYKLEDLDEDHASRRYIESRGFDPNTLSKIYGVSYCAFAQDYRVHRRILIPVYNDGNLVGWQARYVGELDWKGENKSVKKYHTCPGMRKSLCLYNLDRAKHYPTGVVVEGVTDVWSFGPMAVSGFGDKISPGQVDLLVKHFQNKSLLIVLDSEPSALEKAHEVAEELRGRIVKGVAVITLPDGSDPADLDRRVLWQIAKKQAAEQGVFCSFKRA
jgi:hypothetical protein